MVTRSGMPSRSASLNFTPGALVAVVDEHVDAGGLELALELLGRSRLGWSSHLTGTMITSNGASDTGHRMPLSSWFCSTAAASVRDTPMP